MVGHGVIASEVAPGLVAERALPEPDVVLELLPELHDEACAPGSAAASPSAQMVLPSPMGG